MKTILCYGDSNTHGFNPASQGRFSLAERWTGVLMRELGSDYHVIEEGLGGRTTVWDDPIMESRNGRDYLLPCLWSHKPLDLVIIMLGTNDLKDRFSLPPYDIAAGAGALGDLARRSGAGINGGAPEVLLVAPPPIRYLPDTVWGSAEVEARSADLPRYYERQAKAYGFHWMDAGQIVSPSPLDGVHLEAGEHLKLGLAMAQRVREILGR